jgi:hypothetical protein
VEGGSAGAGKVMRAAGGGALIMNVEGTAVNGTGPGSVCVGIVETVYGEMGLDALEGVHVRSPFYKRKAIKHGKNADINSVILQVSYATL